MSKWTTNNIPDQTGKIAIVTGANSGLGYETALALAQKNAQVVMACRDLTKGNAVRDDIAQTVPQAALHVMLLDLASLDSIRAFCEQFQAAFNELHLLINNAGVMAIPEHRKTADGFEMQFGTNHLGHFALTGLLIDTILRTPGARVVTISSSGHRMGKIDFDNLNAEQTYRRWEAYGQSKLANLLFTYELQRKFEVLGADAIATAAHPGWTATNLQVHASAFRFLNPYVAQKPDMGALPGLYAATAPDMTGAEYIGPDGFTGMRGYPKQIVSSKRSHDAAVAARLWDVSQTLTGVTYAGLDD